MSSTGSANPVCIAPTSISYTVTGTDVNGCAKSEIVNVTVVPLPVADFNYILGYNCNGIELRTENKSRNATLYHWSFGDNSISNEINPIHYYITLQNQTIQLIATNGICADTFEIENVSFKS